MVLFKPPRSPGNYLEPTPFCRWENWVSELEWLPQGHMVDWQQSWGWRPPLKAPCPISFHFIKTADAPFSLSFWQKLEIWSRKNLLKGSIWKNGIRLHEQTWWVELTSQIRLRGWPEFFFFFMRLQKTELTIFSTYTVTFIQSSFTNMMSMNHR